MFLLFCIVFSQVIFDSPACPIDQDSIKKENVTTDSNICEDTIARSETTESSTTTHKDNNGIIIVNEIEEMGKLVNKIIKPAKRNNDDDDDERIIVINEIRNKGKPVNRHVIPAIQKRMNLLNVKGLLGKFSLLRRKTHVHLPRFVNFTDAEMNLRQLREKLNKLEENNDPIKVKKYEKKIALYEKFFDKLKEIKLNSQHGNGEFSSKTQNSMLLDIKPITTDTQVTPNANEEFRTAASFHKDFFDSLSKQNLLMTELLQKLQEEGIYFRKNAFDDFNNLLQEAFIREHSYTSKEDKDLNKRIVGKPTTTTKKIFPTVMTMLDESEVREALLRDPLVVRILKLAKKKREEYLRKVTYDKKS